MRFLSLFSMTCFVVLGGCGGSGGGAPAPEPTTDFVTFVEDRFDETSTQPDPVAINGVTFSGQTTATPQAFDALLSQEAPLTKPGGDADAR